MAPISSELHPGDESFERIPGGLQSLLDRAVDASSNGILITDPSRPDNPVIFANPAFERLSGYRTEEVIGRNCRFLQGWDTDQPGLEELRAAVREGCDCRVVLRNYRKDGTLFWNELHVSAVYDDQGRLTNFVGVQNDVTERKRAEEEKARSLAREREAREEAEAVRRRLALLAAAGPMLAASLEYSETFKQLARLLVPELADWCVVDVIEEDGRAHQLAAAHADPEKERLLPKLSEHRRLDEDAPGSIAEVLRTGQPLFLSEVTDECLSERVTGKEHFELLRELGVGSMISVPLVASGRVLGAITLLSKDSHRYDREDLSLAEDLAHRCALAVENGRLYRDRSHISRTLQRSLLPPTLPEIPGIELGVQYLPMGRESEVGGDFYDLIDTRYDGWVCVVGDVCGKGAGAAVTTALARYTVRAVVLQKDRPSEILSALNKAMLDQSPSHQFCTVACARLEPEGDSRVKLTISRGGHPPPFLLRTDGSIEDLGNASKAMGVFPDPEFEDQVLHLDAGDTVVFYTDGITEARAPDGAIFGEDRLRSLVRSCRGLSACDTARKIKDVALEFEEGSLRDDIAILVLRVAESRGG